jgi:hypothetical protein
MGAGSITRTCSSRRPIRALHARARVGRRSGHDLGRRVRRAGGRLLALSALEGPAAADEPEPSRSSPTPETRLVARPDLTGTGTKGR